MMYYGPVGWTVHPNGTSYVPDHTFQAWGLGLARTKQDPISRTHEKKSRAYSKIGHWSGKLTRRDQGMTSPMGYTEAGRGSCELGTHVTFWGRAQMT